MVFDLEALRNEESELTKNLTSASNKDKDNLKKKINSIRSRIANISAFEKLKIGCYVSKDAGFTLGKVTEKSQENQPIVFILWAGQTISFPEQPGLLELDEIANSGIVKIDDIVRVANKENSQIIGYRLGKIIELQAHGWIQVSGSEILSTAHWRPLEDSLKDFDRWDFDWIVGETSDNTNAETWGTVLARANRSTLNLALEWINQYSSEDKDRIEALEKRLRQLESPATSIPPLEYLQQLSIVVHPPIAAMKIDAASVDKLLHMAVAAVTAEENITEYLIAHAQEFALSKGLVLKVIDAEWLITPQCKTVEEAIALCPAPGDRVIGIGENGSPRFGSLERCDTAGESQEIQVQALIRWDDGTVTLENGFTLEILPPLFEYLSNVESAQIDVLSASPENPDIVEPRSPLPLGFQEVSVSELRSHPINCKIYGEQEDDTVLEEMIRQSNWIKPLLATPNGDVVGGNRRLRVAQRVGYEKLAIEVREFADDEAILEALLLDNASREKSNEQKIREARIWIPIETEKANRRRGKKELQENFPGTPVKGQVRDIIAARVGLGSGRNFQKADKVLTLAENLRSSDPERAATLLDFLNNQSINAAYMSAFQDAMAEFKEKLKGWTPVIGERVKISLASEVHAGVVGVAKSSGGSSILVEFDQESEGLSNACIHLALLAPEDKEAAIARLEAAKLKQPGVSLGIKSKKDSVLPDVKRNDGIEPDLTVPGFSPTDVGTNLKEDMLPINAEPMDVVANPVVSSSNVIQMPVKVEQTNDVVLEIAQGICHLSPEEIAYAINWACNVNDNSLTNAHLKAIISVAQAALEGRHSIAN